MRHQCQCLDDVVTGKSWWRHQMETFSGLLVILAICAGNSPVPGEFTAQKPVTLMFYLIYAWINGWVNNREAGDLRRHRAHYDVTVLVFCITSPVRTTVDEQVMRNCDAFLLLTSRSFWAHNGVVGCLKHHYAHCRSNSMLHTSRFSLFLGSFLELDLTPSRRTSFS